MNIGMEPTLSERPETRLALFVGGPVDGFLRMVEVDENWSVITHVYVADVDGVTRHMYGAAIGTRAEYRYLGSLPSAPVPPGVC